ncbi:hypothetical protein VII00023_19916 [Vibrio ichthyoenteri ATCC 700023]|uniref:Uncharacterized protein n=1 Tax=Vibrio ichthyoenteri ATCC 700023 TaxID=870968 RepID=F9S2R1_9VIBR|nr:hypothetical protein VII00023_19916 [Vibrio ichthyoenteri ATCC 700023]
MIPRHKQAVRAEKYQRRELEEKEKPHPLREPGLVVVANVEIERNDHLWPPCMNVIILG